MPRRVSSEAILSSRPLRKPCSSPGSEVDRLVARRIRPGLVRETLGALALDLVGGLEAFLLAEAVGRRRTLTARDQLDDLSSLEAQAQARRQLAGDPVRSRLEGDLPDRAAPDRGARRDWLALGIEDARLAGPSLTGLRAALVLARVGHRE